MTVCLGGYYQNLWSFSHSLSAPIILFVGSWRPFWQREGTHPCRARQQITLTFTGTHTWPASCWWGVAKCIIWPSVLLLYICSTVFEVVVPQSPNLYSFFPLCHHPDFLLYVNKLFCGVVASSERTEQNTLGRYFSVIHDGILTLNTSHKMVHIRVQQKLQNIFCLLLLCH